MTEEKLDIKRSEKERQLVSALGDKWISPIEGAKLLTLTDLAESVKGNHNGTMNDLREFSMQHALLSVQGQDEGGIQRYNQFIADMIIRPVGGKVDMLRYEVLSERLPKIVKPFTFPDRVVYFSKVETPSWQVDSLRDPDLNVWGFLDQKVRILPKDFDRLHAHLKGNHRVLDYTPEMDSARLQFESLPKETVEFRLLNKNSEIKYYLTTLKDRVIWYRSVKL